MKENENFAKETPLESREKTLTENEHESTSIIYDKAIAETPEMLCESVFSMWLHTSIGRLAHPGEFIMVSPLSDIHLLMRPISICDVKPEARMLRIVWRVAGSETLAFTRIKAGDPIKLMGPLGKGFPLYAAEGKKNIVLMGGGIGAPPLLFLAKALKEKFEKEKMPENPIPSITAILGYRSAAPDAGKAFPCNENTLPTAGREGDSSPRLLNPLFLKEEFRAYSEVLISTDDGSAGIHGTVLDAYKEHFSASPPDLIYACGPLPMLSGIKRLSEETGLTAYISLEERMACGIGACLGCVTKTRAIDSHSKVHNARICTEGPVFNAKEVIIK